MFENREERDKNNETGLKEGRGIEMSTTVLQYTRCSLSSLKYSPVDFEVDFFFDCSYLYYLNYLLFH